MSDTTSSRAESSPTRDLPKSPGSAFEGRTFYIKTFGCQMNVHDSERMAGLLSAEGGRPVSEPQTADIILVNTCTIRDKADQKALSDLGRIRQVRKDGPGTILAVTGCMAQREGEEIFRLVPDVDLILGPSQIRNLIPLLDTAAEKNSHVDGTLWPVPEMTTPPALRPPGVSAFLTVQEGCDKACAYCVVPATRGAERSRPVGDILQEAEDLVSMGYREITLLGQNVNGYGKKGDTAGASFPELLQRLSEIPGLLRVRFTTSHPMDMSDALIEVMATAPRVMPHLHLPVQSGSDRMLEKMQRGYDLKTYRRWVEKLREKVPAAALTTDLIVGFCSETEDDFQQTLSAVEEFRFDGAFAFIYSPRPSTPAHGWGETPPREVSVERLERLQKRVEQQSMERNQSLVGTEIEILTEKWDPETRTAFGRTPQFMTVRAIVSPDQSDPVPGDLLTVHISQAARAGLKGNASPHA